MKTRVEKVFTASLDNLYEMLGYIVDFSRSLGFSKEWVAKIELASEEALVNIISYGYPGRPGSIEILCMLATPQGMTIVISDEGVPYNPLTNPVKFDPGAPLESRGIGGYGIFFILKVMDEVDYRREGGKNILILTKFLS